MIAGNELVDYLVLWLTFPGATVWLPLARLTYLGIRWWKATRPREPSLPSFEAVAWWGVLVAGLTYWTWFGLLPWLL
jgi:hypothetical protein